MRQFYAGVPGTSGAHAGTEPESVGDNSGTHTGSDSGSHANTGTGTES